MDFQEGEAELKKADTPRKAMATSNTPAQDKQRTDTLSKLNESEKLIKKHEELKKQFIKELTRIATKSRNLVFENVKNDKCEEKHAAIGKGIGAVGSGITFLGAVITPFFPPAGLGLAVFGSGVGIVGHICFGLSLRYRIKSKKGKKALGEKEFNLFYEKIKEIVEQYDEAAMLIIQNLGALPTVCTSQNFQEQLENLKTLVETSNQKDPESGCYPFLALSRVVNTIMEKNNQLTANERTTMMMTKIVEDTKKSMETALHQHEKKMEDIDINYQEEKPKNYLKEVLVTTVQSTSVPVAGVLIVSGVATKTGDIAANTANLVAGAVPGSNLLFEGIASVAGVGTDIAGAIFGGSLSFIMMGIGGFQSRRAYTKYKGLKDLMKKAEDEDNDIDQLRILGEKKEYAKFAEKAITTIEITETMAEILTNAV